MELVEEAIALAVKAHAGQKDKVGAAYILHPLRLMCRMETDEQRMAAVLHDVVEDTGHSLNDLRSHGFPESVLAAVELLTRRESDSYEEFIERVLPDPIARKVKLADLEDNLNVLRMHQLAEKDMQRINRYIKAHRRIKEFEAGMAS